MSDSKDLGLLKEAIQKEIDKLEPNFNKLDTLDIIAGKDLGMMKHIPQVTALPEDETIPSLAVIDINITKDVLSSTKKTFTYRTGYAIYGNLKDNNFKGTSWIVAIAKEAMKNFHGWGPEEPHFGTYLKVSGASHLEDAAGIVITFESVAIPLIKELEKTN